MNSIILSLITRTIIRLGRLSASLRRKQAQWFTNHSGHRSFHAKVIPSDEGFAAIIFRRTGYSSRDWKYEQLCSAGHFSSFRKALRAGRQVAQEMADLRYRFD